MAYSDLEIGKTAEDRRHIHSHLGDTSPSVQTHLGITQSVIQRMASNSASYKTWCITIVSAMLMVLAGKSKQNIAVLAVLPSVFFAALDAYYLALEKVFRESCNSFIDKLHSGRQSPKDLYSVSPTVNLRQLQFDAIKSYSILGFYLPLIVLIIVAKYLAL